MDELKPLILHILNTIIEELDIPQMLKRGIMTPVLKKNKDRQNPANYRGITVTKIFTKIIQSILKSRVGIQIDQIQNPVQRGLIYRSNFYAICSFHSIRGHNKIQHK